MEACPIQGDIVCFLGIEGDALADMNDPYAGQPFPSAATHPPPGATKDAQRTTCVLAFLPDQDPAYARKLDIGKHTPPGYWEPHGDGRDS